MDRYRVIAAFCASLALLEGCSLTLESEKPQCSEPKDCVQYSSEYALTCKGGLCIRDEERECRTTAACQEGAACEIATGQCVLAPPCVERKDCAAYEGAEDFACLQKVCLPPECGADADCAADGPNFTCDEGECVDKIWGCIDQPDQRPLDDEDGLATFRIRVLYAPTQNMEEIPIKNLKAVVCLPGDPTYDCDAGAGDAKWTYDESTGWLEVTSLRNNEYYNIKLAGEGPTGPVLPGKIYMYRPVVGVTEETEPALMFTAESRDFFGRVLRVPLDPENTGLVIARVFDCEGNSAEKVSLRVDPSLDCKVQPTNGTTCRTVPFYFDNDDYPDKDAVQTGLAGVAGAINTQAGVTTTFLFTLDGKNDEYTKKSFAPIANEVSYLAVYPGRFP